MNIFINQTTRIFVQARAVPFNSLTLLFLANGTKLFDKVIRADDEKQGDWGKDGLVALFLLFLCASKLCTHHGKFQGRKSFACLTLSFKPLTIVQSWPVFPLFPFFEAFFLCTHPLFPHVVLLFSIRPFLEKNKDKQVDFYGIMVDLEFPPEHFFGGRRGPSSASQEKQLSS